MTRESTYGLEPGSLFFVRFHRPTIPKTKKCIYYYDDYELGIFIVADFGS